MGVEVIIGVGGKVVGLVFINGLLAAMVVLFAGDQLLICPQKTMTKTIITTPKAV